MKDENKDSLTQMPKKIDSKHDIYIYIYTSHIKRSWSIIYPSSWLAQSHDFPKLADQGTVLYRAQQGGRAPYGMGGLGDHSPPSPARRRGNSCHELVIWLVVWNPLKNFNQVGWLFQIYGKIKNVPHHQPVIVSESLDWRSQFQAVNSIHGTAIPSGCVKIALENGRIEIWWVFPMKNGDFE